MALAPFIALGKGLHPILDYPLLERNYPDLPLDVWNITSASDLIAWERLRAKYSIQDDISIPCDLFVWGTGVPPDARMTRIGGTPWLPKRQPWPEIDGVIPTFLCQFNFQDSRDLHEQRVSRHLPGDILLVFVAEEDTACCCEVEQMRFIWVSADEKEVIGPGDAPTPTHPFEFIQAWGARYRTQDIPSKWDEAFAIPEDTGEGRCWSLPVLWGTKIGGVPYDSQDSHSEAHANFLCLLTSVQASEETDWPWIDREDAFSDTFGDGNIYTPKNSLSIGDMGELSFYLDDNGKVSIESACG